MEEMWLVILSKVQNLQNVFSSRENWHPTFSENIFQSWQLASNILRNSDLTNFKPCDIITFNVATVNNQLATPNSAEWLASELECIIKLVKSKNITLVLKAWVMVIFDITRPMSLLIVLATDFKNLDTNNLKISFWKSLHPYAPYKFLHSIQPELGLVKLSVKLSCFN